MEGKIMDETKLNQMIGKMLGDLGGAATVALVRMGDALGLYKTLHQQGSMTCDELAIAANVNSRYLREWLANQTASEYLTYDPDTRKFTLPEEQAMMFAVEDSPVAMMGAFDGIVAWMEQAPKVQVAFKQGGGVGWGDHSSCLFSRLVHGDYGAGVSQFAVHRL
jgi:hypothetical protein